MKIKRKLFNGYVREPLPIFLIGVCIILCTLVESCWITWTTLHKALPCPDNIETYIVSYEINGPNCQIATSAGYNFYLPSEAISDISILSNLVDSETVQIEYDRASYDKRSDDFCIISLMEVNGSYIISGDAISEANAENEKKNILYSWGFTGVSSFLLGLAYYILCNAPRYPHIANLLIRKEYRYF